MNQYPLWKYVMIAVITVIGLIYASPILFPSDYAVQVTPSGNVQLTEQTLASVKTSLSQQGINVKKIEFDTEASNQKILVRFDDSDTQLRAAKTIRDGLGDDDYVTALNLAPTTPGWLRGLNANPMYLGLDLRGGVHFLMEVDMKYPIDEALNDYKNNFQRTLREAKINYLGVVRKGETLVIKFRDQEQMAQGHKELNELVRGDMTFSEIETDKGFALQAKMSEKFVRETKKFALQQNITTLRNRVNELGVSEPVIQQQGLNRIIVQLPGIQDTARAKEILGATATLAFHLVDDSNNPFEAQSTGRIPAGDKLYKEKDGNPILLKRKLIIAGDSVTNAAAGFDRNNRPAVNLRLDSKGGKRMLKFTTQHVKQRMGVVFIETKYKTKKDENGKDMKDDKGNVIKIKTKKETVINAATVQEPFGAAFEITGLDSPKESHNLALLLRAGALKAPVYIVEERTVGPSLGAANISAGFNSVMMGFILVLIFMAVYYKVFGLVANLALSLNLVLIVAALSMMQATLTLPGIAGIVLTVGMAVDANVLIFERIKEELANGVSPHAAINSGYEKAFSTIADANITTLIAAVVLYGFGTGPIKGFAITLAIGILSSMFTAILGSRALINLIYGNRKIKKLAI
jgi:preprotein translocase subunit SecD